MIQLKTHKEFLDMMLNNLEYTEDKTPNSFAYDNLSSVAVLAGDLQDIIYKLSLLFDVDNLEGELLEKRVFQVAGLTRKEPTQAYGLVEVYGIPGTVIPLDIKFYGNGVEYTIDKEYVIPEDGVTKVMVTCTEPGPVGNVSPEIIDTIKPNVVGVARVANPLIIENGYIREPDDDLRERYYEKLANPPKAGNPAHYKLWAEEVDGIGNAKVFRTWKGPSTVKVVLVGMDRAGVDDEMIKKVFDHIMEEAPIHWENLTVVSATEVPVDLKLNITLKNGYLLETVKENIIYNVEKYLYQVSFRQSFISYAKLGCAIMSADGVLDHEDFTINGIRDNMDLGNEEVGVLGNLDITITDNTGVIL